MDRLHFAWQRSSVTKDHNVYFRDDQLKLPLFRRQRLGVKKVQWVYLLLVLAVVTVVVTCRRALRVGSSFEGFGRRLAGGSSEDEKEEQSALVNICLDLEEDWGLIQQQSAPLEEPSKALSQILEFLTGQSEQTLQPGSEPQSALESLGPLTSKGELTAPTSYAEETGWGAESGQTQTGGSLRVGEFEQATSSASFSTPPHPARRPTGIAQLAPPQKQSFPFAVTGMEETVQPSGSKVVIGQKRSIGGPGIEITSPEKRMRQQTRPPFQPKKHTSGWKGQGHRQLEQDPSSPAQQQVQEYGPESPDEDPILKALQSVPVTWSPEPLDVSEWQPTEVRESDKEEQHVVQRSEPTAAFQLKKFISDLELPTDASASLHGLATSQKLTQEQASSFEDSSPGPSGLPPTAAPQSSDAGGADPQPQPIPPLPGPAPVMPPNTHLFYRLPVLQAGAVVPRFNVSHAFSVRSDLSNGLPYLKTARQLLAMRELSSRDASVLVHVIECIVEHLMKNHQKPVEELQPCHAVDALGVRYLMLEVVFCAIQVIGSPMGASEWWPRLVNAIPTHYSGQKTGRGARGSTWQNVLVARRLSSALWSLKNGIRPGEEETVALKRALLCHRDVGAVLKTAQWDPWRKDDEESEDGGTR